MRRHIFILTFICLVFTLNGSTLIYDTAAFDTKEGKLEMVFIGHASMMMKFKTIIIHIDPFSGMADYKELPKADIILITHHHRDHLDPVALKLISKKETKIIAPKRCAAELNEPEIMNNGDEKRIAGILIKAVPAYNIVNRRKSGEAYHVKGEGNGYVLTLSDKKIYIAGDTEDVPEMKNLKNIDVAFLPMNLPYTMTPGMTANAAKMFKPKVLYPYHYGKTDRNILVNLLKNEKEIEVRLANFYPKNN